MRKHHVIAVIAVLLVGLGVKQFFFPPKAAEAYPHAVTLDIRQMHLDHPNLPMQKMHDMTFVFDGE